MFTRVRRRKWKQALLFGAGVVLVALTAVAAVIVTATEGLSANSAAWVQAGGSIAAILGAVWLFGTEQSVRRRERRAFGEEIAWAVRFALTNAQLEARTIAGELVADDLLDSEGIGRDWCLRTANCANVLRVFAERPDHIHPALNHIASNGMLLLRQMDADIARALAFVETGERPSMKSASDIAWYESHFEQLIQLLDARMRGIRLALDQAADQPPSRPREIWEVLAGEGEAEAHSRGCADSPRSKGLWPEYLE